MGKVAAGARVVGDQRSRTCAICPEVSRVSVPTDAARGQRRSTIEGMLHMPQGTIKKLVKDRGFGFISMGSGQGDVFFHVSSVEEGVLELAWEVNKCWRYR